MGNAASCAPLIILGSGVVKVLSSDGKLEIFPKPVKAVEIMLRNPGEFVCESESLKVGQRIEGLSGDEELERGQFYFLLPMELFYSVLTQEEMSSLSYKATRALKHSNSNNFGRIFPVLSEFCMFPSEAKTLDSADQIVAVENVERFSKQRSWRPALETIVETPSS